MSDRDDYIYSERVCFEIKDTDWKAYSTAAEYINRYGYDVLSVQHEYGIFGGEAGSYLMGLVREAKMPIVTTLHTVLRDPSPAQRLVMDELLQLSERVVVMSRKAVGFLAEVHHVPEDKVDFIPHGIPKITEAPAFRAQLGIDGPMILTFGLLSPDKGIQYAIEAMPMIVREHPGATYVIVGATHPNIRASAGESYRQSLVALAQELGVADNVRFVDRFVTADELVQYLGAMDFYVTPYLNPKQITSGTLAYAVGAGKGVISTPYWYAEELLAEGRGVLVPFRDPEAIADAVLAIQRDPARRADMGRKAAEFGSQMLWPDVGRSYLETFARAKRDSAERLRFLVEKASPSPETEALPEFKLDHLFDLSDDTGILQHATYTIPNRSEGYCLDDNARALLLTAYLGSESPLPRDIASLQCRYLSFVQDAFNYDNNRFRNFMSYGRHWLEQAGSQDSQGRALWALGAMVHRCRDESRREVAKDLFRRGAGALMPTTSPRTWAYGVLAAHEYLKASIDPAVLRLQHTLGERLLNEYRVARTDGWLWFEEGLAYANARLPQALILAGEAEGESEMLHAGLESLEWLMELQTGPDGVFAPIGTNGFYHREGERALFDQQPIEAWSSVSACLSAHRVTQNPRWVIDARRAFRWFIGHNMLAQPLFDSVTGGCHDGLHEKRMNRNQGAESTLSFLCALAEMREAVPRLLRTPAPEGSYEVR